MARVMLVIQKIVDREAYNRGANIIDLIPAITYRTSQPILLPFPFFFFFSSSALHSVSSVLSLPGRLYFHQYGTGRRISERKSHSRKLHFPRRCLRLKPASFPFVVARFFVTVPRDPQKESCREPESRNPRFAIFVFLFPKMDKPQVSLTKYGLRWDYGI